MTTISDMLLFLIENGPGRTETELALAIFGRDGYQQRINSDCNLLLHRGLVECSGVGAPSDAYRYYPAQH